MPKPDLIIQNIKIAPTSPGVGDTFNVFLTYRNIGKAASSTVTTMYECFRIGSDGVKHLVNGDNLLNTPKWLNPGEIQTFSFSTNLTAENSNQDYTIVRKGDTIMMRFTIQKMLNSIPEADMTNNVKIHTFVIK